MPKTPDPLSFRFRSPHLQQLLPSEHRQFQSVAATWQAVLALAAQRRFFLFLCESTLVTKDVPACNVTMADFRSKLTSALDGKRARFARLYFLTDDELVTFASLELNPTVDPGQTLICKCFQSLSSVDFNRDREIVAVSGLDGERVALTQGVGTKDEPLEKWLAALDAEIRNTLKMGLAKAVDYLESGRGGSLLQFCRLEKNDVADAGSESSRGSEPGGFEEVGPSSLPCQSVGLALQVSFTRRVEKILSREESADLKRRNLHSELERLQEQVEDLRTAVGKGLAGLARVKAKLLIRLGARLSRTLQKLIECSGKDLHTERFAWQKHLRFYYDPAAPRGASCRMEMAGAKLNYGFEFLGQQERAIVTSEMERCFAGLLGAVASGGCALVTGTPGAGRAELVRALAAAAGKTCLFEVCSGGMSLDRLNGQMRASIASGTWFCLRDVGAVGADVAQSLVQQLASVKQALTSSGGRVQLAGSTVQVDRTAAVFCTAQIDGPQPSDRLTATCRATALGNGAMVADVAGALLHAEGFENWEGLGRKLATALRFASQQLGARPFAAGLPAAHALVERAVRARAEMTSAGFGNVSEEALLAGVVERAIAPGLLGDELTSFQRLLTNVFPGGSRPGDTNGRLKEAVREAVRERGLSEVSGTVQKCVQLQECMALDCLGTVVCGEAGAGKSELIAVLARAKEKLTGSKVAIESVAVAGTSAEKLATTCDEILARQDCDTWVVFDGAIGADQADAITGRFGQDSRLFALAGGKGHRLKVIFEVDSPENIPSVLQGRCALVHVGRGEAVDWNALVKAWVERSLPPSWAKEAALFKHLCEKALPACLELVMSGAPANLDLVPTGLVQSFLCLVGITLASFYSASGTQRPKSGREEGPEADQGKGRRRLISYGRKQARDMVSWRRLHLHKEGEGKLHNRETVDAALKSKLDDVKPSERAHLLTTAAVFATVNSLGLAIAGATDRAALEHVIRDVIRDLGLKEAPPLPEESLFEVGYSWQFRSWRRWPELRTESAAADGKASGVPSGDVRFFVPVPETARNEVLAKTVLRGGGRVAVYGPPGSGKKSLIGHVVRNAAKEEDGRKSGGMETAGWGQFLEKSESSACGCSGITIDSEGSERPNARLLRKYNLLPTVPYSCDSLVAIFAEQLGAAWPERAAGMGGTNEPGRSTPGLPDSLVLRLSKASIHFHQTLLQTLPNPSEELGLGTRDLLNLLGALVTNSDALKATSDALTSDSDAPTAGKDAGLPATDADAVKLWAHEVRRVYGDRLSAAAAVESALAAAAALYLREWASLAAQPVMFGQYTRHSDANGDVRVRAVYKEVTDKPGWVLGMEGQLAAHNMENSDPLPIVLFPEAAEHLSRLLRALRGPGSQALLIGPPRSGKRSLLRLAAFVLGFDRFEIGEKNGNEPGEWREEVGKAVERAALGDRGVVLGVKAGQPGLMKDVAQLRNGHEVCFWCQFNGRSSPLECLSKCQVSTRCRTGFGRALRA